MKLKYLKQNLNKFKILILFKLYGNTRKKKKRKYNR